MTNYSHVLKFETELFLYLLDSIIDSIIKWIDSNLLRLDSIFKEDIKITNYFIIESTLYYILIWKGYYV